MKPTTLVLVAALALGACSSQQVNSATNAVASAAPAFASDALIVAQIEGAFATIAPDSALHVAVSSHDGAVHLSGRVRSASVRDRFVARAKSIDHVTGVTSALTVDPKLPDAKAQVADFALMVAVETALAGQTGINALQVHVSAHDGVVTLSGPVASPALRATMLATARKTSGVRSVRDELAKT